MGLFLGWPIHRARGAPEEAPAPGQRQAGAACFPRQSTNAPERGAWRPWRAQPARAQPPPAAAAPSPPRVPPPRRAPGPQGPSPSPASRGRRPLLARAPRAARRPRAPRPTRRAPQSPVLSRLSAPPRPLTFCVALLALASRPPSSISPSLPLRSRPSFLLVPPRPSLATFFWTLLPLQRLPLPGPCLAPCPRASVSPSSHFLPAQCLEAWPREEGGWFPR